MDPLAVFSPAARAWFERAFPAPSRSRIRRRYARVRHSPEQYPRVRQRRYGQERTLVVDLEEPAPPLEVPGARVTRVDGPRQWLAFRRDETAPPS